MVREIGLVIVFWMFLGCQPQAQDQSGTSSPVVLDLHGQLVPLPNNLATYSIEYYASKEKKIVIAGKVTDIEGMAIANATVTLGPQLGRPIFSVSTNEKGLYTVCIDKGIEPPILLYLKTGGVGYSTKVIPVVLGGGQYKIQVSLSPYMG